MSDQVKITKRNTSTPPKHTLKRHKYVATHGIDHSADTVTTNGRPCESSTAFETWAQRH